MSKTTIPTGGITADAINGTLIADDAINSEHYTDGSIDTAHIGDSQVTSAKTSGVGKALGITTTTVISQNTTNSTSFSQITAFNTSYNVQASGSTIHIRLCGSIRNDGGGSGSRRQTIKINFEQNGGTDTTLIQRDLGNGQDEDGYINLEGTFTSNTTGSCAVTVFHKSNNSGDTVRLVSEFGISGQTGFLTVSEYGA